jgi:hypothetical protein
MLIFGFKFKGINWIGPLRACHCHWLVIHSKNDNVAPRGKEEADPLFKQEAMNGKGREGI